MMSHDDDAPPRATPQQIRAVQDRRRVAAQIADGRLPQLFELYLGLGFATGDWKTDLRIWCNELKLDPSLADYADIIQHTKATCSRQALEALRDVLEVEDDGHVERIDVYLAAAGDTDARARVATAILSPDYGRPDAQQILFGLAVARSVEALNGNANEISRARAVLRMTYADLEALDRAGRQLAEDAIVPTAEEDLHEKMAALEEAIREDRAEIDPEIKPPVGLIVVPAEAALATKSGARKEILAGYTGLIGAPLPWIEMPDLGTTVEAMGQRLPHAVGVFQRIIGSLQPGDPVRYRPTLLVGEAGTGKTTLARAIAEILGQPVEVHGMAGASDASIMGTSAQWHSARESVVLQLIKRTRIANPLVVFDELEKVGEGRNNGNAAEALLPLLEPHTAKAIRDPALEVPVDLSMVSYIATANSLTGIPRPLLDRFNVIRMPEPGWQHIGTLSRGILDKIAEERSLDRRWFPDLEGDEIEVIKKVWPGGSIRKLEKAVRILVDGRDAYLGRA
jgi:ATP-dependent Lon protease, bacterial type